MLLKLGQQLSVQSRIKENFATNAVDQFVIQTLDALSSIRTLIRGIVQKPETFVKFCQIYNQLIKRPLISLRRRS